MRCVAAAATLCTSLVALQIPPLKEKKKLGAEKEQQQAVIRLARLGPVASLMR